MKNIQLILQDKCQYDCFYCPLKGEGSNRKEAENADMFRGANVELCGGEPLLLDDITETVKRLKAVDGIGKVRLTTNGILLAGKADELKAAGLDGVNIHVDTIESVGFTKTTGCEQLLNEVLKGIWKAVAIGMPTTVTVVVHKYSLSGCAVMAGLAKQLPIVVRFVWEGEYSAGIDEKTVFEKIRKTAGRDIENEDGLYRPKGWAGSFTFGKGISGAFGTEDSRRLEVSLPITA